MLTHQRTSDLQPGLQRSHSSASRAGSSTTYHSFHDIELYEPVLSSTPPSRTATAEHAKLAAEQSFAMIDRRDFKPRAVHSESREETQSCGEESDGANGSVTRRDSGYESTSAAAVAASSGIRSAPSSRPSSRRSSRHHHHHRRSSTMSIQTSTTVRAGPKTRPSMRHASKSTPIPRSVHGIHTRTSSEHARTQQPQHHFGHGHSYYQFPSLEGIPGSQPNSQHLESYMSNEQNVSRASVVVVEPPSLRRSSTSYHGSTVPIIPAPMPEQSLPPSPTPPSPPPQTTHYWTSDHTRRLEYAAIDAASRGVKGWILRHIVPDCFVPNSNKRLAFDDDRGSVRRYRLELQDDSDLANISEGVMGEEGANEKGWRGWGRQRQQQQSTKKKFKWLFGDR